jgi:hypothetical protein
MVPDFRLVTQLNYRHAMDARVALCFHTEDHWSGASESDCSAATRGNTQNADLDSP